MSSYTPARFLKHFSPALFMACSLFLGASFLEESNLNAETRSKSASFAASLPAGIWTGIKLSNMNAGATLDISGTSSAPLPVLLFSNLDNEEFLPEEDALVAVVSENEFSFDYQLREDGDYVLVLDNREGSKEVTYDIKATVSLESS